VIFKTKYRVPCKNCMLVPICKHKSFVDLIGRCSNIHNWLYSGGKSMNITAIYWEKKGELRNELNPTSKDGWATIEDFK
jgi:hypothetical protein